MTLKSEAFEQFGGFLKWGPMPIGSMYGIYANIGDILMGSMLPYIAYMDPMGCVSFCES